MTRHLVTIDDLTEEEIQAIFSLADEFLAEMSTPQKRHRVRGRKSLADQFIQDLAVKADGAEARRARKTKRSTFRTRAA